MKPIRISFMIAALALAACPKSKAQIFVSQKEAVKAAVNYINGYLGEKRTYTINDLAYYATETKANVTLLHEVHLGGYKLILSGVKSCKPVLIYSKDSTETLLLDDNDESGVSYFLDRYCNEIIYEIGNSQKIDTVLEDWRVLLSDNALPSAKQGGTMGPLLTTIWGQSVSNDEIDSNAYNYWVDESCSSCDGDKPPTGCVATAIGQIMNYWKHPVLMTTSETQFDWCHMADMLNSDDSDYEINRNAIARLLSEVGLAVNMNYCFGGCNSFATPWNAEAALKNNFSYSNDAELRWRAANMGEWKSMLVDEIMQGRPIFYSAIQGLVHGHAFVVHGFNSSTDMFCVNFGHRANETWTTIDAIGLEGETDYTNAENAIFYLTPENQLDYCDVNLNLSSYYQSYYSENGTSEPHLCVPQTATTLTSCNSSAPRSWRTIPARSSSEYVAHKTVVLQHGFHAEKGSEFVAKIVPCKKCDYINMDLSYEDATNAEYDDFIDGRKGVSIEENGMELISNDGERLYPNPCKNRITYKGKDVKQVFVYNMMGKPVFQWFVVSKSDDEVTLDIKAVESGMYLLLVANNDGSYSSHKFVKD